MIWLFYTIDWLLEKLFWLVWEFSGTESANCAKTLFACKAGIICLYLHCWIFIIIECLTGSGKLFKLLLIQRLWIIKSNISLKVRSSHRTCVHMCPADCWLLNQPFQLSVVDPCNFCIPPVWLLRSRFTLFLFVCKL